MADVDSIQAKEFRLVINTCRDVYGDDPAANCKTRDEIDEKLNTFYVDVITLSQYFYQGVAYYNYGTQLTLSSFQRYFLGKDISNLVEQSVQQQSITKHRERAFGSKLFGKLYTVYQMAQLSQRTFPRIPNQITDE